MTIGFIGAGNIANAIIKGLTKIISKDDIYIYDISKDATDKSIRENGVNLSECAESLIKKCDVVVLSVKPHIIESVLLSHKDTFSVETPYIISVAAAKTIESIARTLDYNASITRVMPNINAEISESMTAICHNENVNDEQKKISLKIFDSVGETIEIDEKFFAVFSGIAGCSPAFTFLFIDTLAKAAHKEGMSKKDAIKIASQAVLGSAKMLLGKDIHPIELIDRVCSPGGTTIEGIYMLEKNNFQNTVVDAVLSTIEKDKKLRDD